MSAINSLPLIGGMMKKLAFLNLCVFCTLCVPTYSAVEIYVPLLAKKNKEVISLSSLNVDLSDTDSKIRFTDYIIVENVKTAAKELNEIDDKVNQAAEILGLQSVFLRYYTARGFTRKQLANPLCYDGNSHEVVKFISSLADEIFYHPFTIVASKYKKDIQFYISEKEKDALPEDPFPTLWNTWRGTTESILLIYTEGKESDNYKDVIIRKCSKQEKN